MNNFTEEKRQACLDTISELETRYDSPERHELARILKDLIKNASDSELNSFIESTLKILKERFSFKKRN